MYMIYESVTYAFKKVFMPSWSIFPTVTKNNSASIVLRASGLNQKEVMQKR